MYLHNRKEEDVPDETTDFAIFYAPDGKEMAECIQQRLTDTRFGCSISITDFSQISKDLQNDNSSQPVNVNVLIVSPSFLAFAKSSPDLFHHSTFQIPEKTIVLYFYVDVTDAMNTIKDMCESTFKWTHKDIGSTKESLRECFITLLTVLEEDALTTLPVLKRFSLLPSTVSSVVDRVCVTFTSETRGKVEVVQGADRYDAVFYNPYTYIFTPKCYYSGMCDVEVFVDGSSAGKACLHYVPPIKELEQCLNQVVNPLDVLCSAVIGEGSAVGILDQTLVHMFCNSEAVLKSEPSTSASEERSSQELPTLLHFAAKFGLKDLCSAILDSPGGRSALTRKGRDGLTPIGIALKHQHNKLAKTLRVILSAPKPNANDNEPEDSLEPYCDMKIDDKKRLRGVKSLGHYDVIQDQSLPENQVQRSNSVPASVTDECDAYMQMDVVKERQANRPEYTEVTRRLRRQQHMPRESARISLIMEEELPLVPRPLQRQERVYMSIHEVNQLNENTPLTDTNAFRKS